MLTILLVALSCNSSWSTTAQLLGDIWISICEMLHLPSDSAGTNAGIYMHTMKSLVDDSCKVSLFHKKFNDILMTAIFLQCRMRT